MLCILIAISLQTERQSLQKSDQKLANSAPASESLVYDTTAKIDRRFLQKAETIQPWAHFRVFLGPPAKSMLQL